MKKLLLLTFLFFLSCNKDSRKFKINNFNNSRVDTLKPYRWKDYSPIGGYALYRIKIQGYTNDTIKIRHEGAIDINLFGKIDTLITSDYYGTYDMIVTFDPYKATQGELLIEYKL